VSDLLAPAEKGQSWMIVGSVFDPEAGATIASTWTADDAHTWERADVDPARAGVSEGMTAAVHDDAGTLAVGWVGDGSASDAALWRNDGEGWTFSSPAAMGGDHEQWAFDVATSEAGTLVAGGESVWGEVRARLWFSPDGTTWESVDGGPGGPFDTTGDESVRDIAAVGSGFVAVGSTNVDSDQNGAVWFSPDGVTWAQVDAPTLGGAGRQELESVTWTGRVVVAGGYAGDRNGQGQPVVWRSTDARTWSAASSPLRLYDDPRTGAADNRVSSLTFGAGEITAAGGSDWRPHLWRSKDEGKTWELLPNPVHGQLFADGVSLLDTAADGKSRVALGAEPSVLYLDSAGRWQDASAKAFPSGGQQPFATSVAVGEDVTVAAGGLHTAQQGATREGFVGQVWLERANGAWEAIDNDQFADGQLTDVVAYKGGYAAVGVEAYGRAAQRKYLGDNEPDGLIWTSPDGDEWQRVGAVLSPIASESLEVLPDPDASDAPAILDLLGEQPPETVSPAGGKGARSLDAAAPIGNGFIAVGVAYVDGDADPIVVVSSDGKSVKGENPGAAGAGTQVLSDVCVHGGEAIVVGSSDTGKGNDVLVRHRAKDGTWAKVTDDGSFGGAGNQQAYSCAASADGFVLVGFDDHSGDADARVWTSDDGLEWTRAESGLLGGGGDQWASAVATVPGGGWLIGGTDTAGGDDDVALWRLFGDGEMERRDRGEPALSGTGEQSVTDIVVDEDRVLIVGDDYGRVGLWESDVIDR
jgi:hypothetical protein